MSIFDKLFVFHDESSRNAALNMALDEALLETANEPTLRLYRWDHPALSFGYFGKFADVADEPRDIVRRWTGGGIVPHGDDLTYGLIIPAEHAAFSESTMSIYEKTHRAIQCAIGEGVTLAGGRDAALRRPRTAQRAVLTEECFANPVRADVMLDGRKIAGAAQRKTRRGLLQQGSIQYVDLALDFGERFARELSPEIISRKIDNRILERAQEIAAAKYATDGWLRRR